MLVRRKTYEHEVQHLLQETDALKHPTPEKALLLVANALKCAQSRNFRIAKFESRLNRKRDAGIFRLFRFRTAVFKRAQSALSETHVHGVESLCVFAQRTDNKRDCTSHAALATKH